MNTVRPLFQTDPNAALVCTAETLSDLKFPLPEFADYITTNRDELLERQNLFRDFLTIPDLLPIFTEGAAKLEELTNFLRRLGNIAEKDNESFLYSIMELLTFTDAVDHFTKANNLPVKSAKLKEFLTSVRTIAEDPAYLSTRAWLDDTHARLRNIRSVTLGVNLDPSLNIREVGIVSLNDQPYVSASILDRMFRKDNPPPEYTCIASVGIRETGKNITERNDLSLDRTFYTAINNLFRGSIKNLHKYLTDALYSTIRSLAEQYAAVVFITQAVSYFHNLRLRNLPFSFPTFTDHTRLPHLYNPLLTEKLPTRQIIPSAVTFDETHRLYVLTGPNSGGKSVYLNAVGIAQIFAQLGLPVPSPSAEMRIFQKICTHFVQKTTHSTESRLAGETIRIREFLPKVTADTLLLFDEVFSSTSAYDGLILAEALLNYLLRIGCTMIYVTHLHELAARIHQGQFPENTVRTLAAKVENGHRTYEITESDGAENPSSLARDVVIENGLGFLFDT